MIALLTDIIYPSLQLGIIDSSTLLRMRGPALARGNKDLSTCLNYRPRIVERYTFLLWAMKENSTQVAHQIKHHLPRFGLII